jgi:hypothetical protein
LCSKNIKKFIQNPIGTWGCVEKPLEILGSREGIRNIHC